jgi:hypothetical protein
MGTRYLYATCSSGLCNRLLMLAGSVRVAEKTDRRLVLDWPVNLQVGSRFDALFLNQFTIMNDEHLTRLFRTDECVRIYNAVGIRPHYNRISADGDPEADIVMIKAWGPPMLDNETWNQQFMCDLQPYLRALQPLPHIVARADEHRLPGCCIGVHIRRGENYAEFFKSADHHFETIMASIVSACPAVKFFLATADPNTEAQFRQRFGERIISFPKTCSGRHHAAIEEAMVDLLLLSRTSAVLGNHFSSYSFAAAVLGPNILVNATEETSTIGLDTAVSNLLARLPTERPEAVV